MNTPAIADVEAGDGRRLRQRRAFGRRQHAIIQRQTKTKLRQPCPQRRDVFQLCDLGIHVESWWWVSRTRPTLHLLSWQQFADWLAEWQGRHRAAGVIGKSGLGIDAEVSIDGGPEIVWREHTIDRVFAL